MKAKMLLLCAMLIIASLKSFAQIDTFDLSKYKVADYKRHQLNINFNTSGYGVINKTNSDTMYQNNKGYGLSTFLNLEYRSILNTRKNIKELGFSTAMSPINFGNSTSTDVSPYGYYEKNKSNSNNSSLALSGYYNNKNYYSGNFFIETGLNTYYSYYRNYNKYNNELLSDEVISKSHSHRVSNFLKLGIGKGRIENVEDARMAIFILNDLYSTQRLSRLPSEDEILEFAEKITKLINKRFFDYRLHRIYEIQAIDSFLRVKNLIKETDALHYATIIDNWNYSNNPVRLSGNRVSFNINPLYSYSFFKQNDSYSTPDIFKTKSQEMGVNINCEWISTKPVSLKWQRDYLFRAGYSKNRLWNTFDDSQDLDYDNITIMADYQLGYYPNSRTYCTLDFNATLNKFWSTASIDNTSDIDLSSGIDFKLYYYISPQFRVNAYARVQYTQNKYPELPFKDGDYSFRPSFSVQFAYSFF